MTHLLVPQQSGTPDSCTTHQEEELFQVQDTKDIITLGWIHVSVAVVILKFLCTLVQQLLQLCSYPLLVRVSTTVASYVAILSLYALVQQLLVM